MTTAQIGGAATAIGLMVRERRIALDLSKAEAARRAGVSRRTWHEIEDGLRATSSAETLVQIDQVLDLPEGTLFAMTSRSAHDKVEALAAAGDRPGAADVERRAASVRRHARRRNRADAARETRSAGRRAAT